MKQSALALVAHDDKKAAMAEFVVAHEDTLARFDLYATGTTGQRLVERCPRLRITRLKSAARRRSADRGDDRGGSASTR